MSILFSIQPGESQLLDVFLLIDEVLRACDRLRQTDLHPEQMTELDAKRYFVGVKIEEWGRKTGSIRD